MAQAGADDPPAPHRHAHQGQDAIAMRGSAGLMARLLRSAETAAQARRRLAVERIARDLQDLGIRAASDRNQLVLTGKGLARRWLTEPALRFAARLGR